MFLHVHVFVQFQSVCFSKNKILLPVKVTLHLHERMTERHSVKFIGIKIYYTVSIARHQYLRACQHFLGCTCISVGYQIYMYISQVPVSNNSQNVLLLRSPQKIFKSKDYTDTVLFLIYK